MRGKNSCVYNFVYYLAAYRNYICPCFANCHLSKYSNSLMRHGCIRCQSIHYSECITLGIRVGYLLNYSQCTQCTSFWELLRSTSLLQKPKLLNNFNHILLKMSKLEIRYSPVFCIVLLSGLPSVVVASPAVECCLVSEDVVDSTLLASSKYKKYFVVLIYIAHG